MEFTDKIHIHLKYFCVYIYTIYILSLAIWLSFVTVFK